MVVWIVFVLFVKQKARQTDQLRRQYMVPIKQCLLLALIWQPLALAMQYVLASLVSHFCAELH